MFVMQNQIIIHHGNSNLQAESAKETGAREFWKLNTFLIHGDKLVLQRAPYFHINFYKMQSRKKNNSDSRTVRGHARNLKMLNMVQENQQLAELMATLAQIGRINTLSVSIKNKGVKIKYFHRHGVVNHLAPTLKGAIEGILQKMQAV